MTEEKDLTQKEKDKTLYKAAVQAFFLNEIESDKMLLGISSGGIGLLATLLSNYQQIYCLLVLLAIICFIAFGMTVISIIQIFKLNKKQVLQIMENNGIPKTNPSFKILNTCRDFSFLIGIFFFSLFFVLNLVLVDCNRHKCILKGETHMEDKQKNEKRQDGFDGTEVNRENNQNSNEQKNQSSEKIQKKE